MSYLGDYTEDFADLNFGFSTNNISAVPTTLVSGVISVYKSNNATQTTAGITLSANFDGVTGLNNVKIDLSADAFYVTGEDYKVVLTAGTVGGVSVISSVVGQFSIENRFSGAGGAGDWTSGEKENIRSALGVDGTKTTASGGQLQVIPTTAMRGTDGVDTATMRGTDGVDTSAMRGTDGANTVTPMTAALSQTEHDATQTAIALIPTTAMRGTDSALLASSNGSGLTEAGGTGDQLTAIPDVGITQASADKVWQTTSRTLTDGIQKNQAFNNFEFLMVLTSDHVTPALGLTVTGQRSIDGGGFGSVTGTIAEVSNGIYQVDFLAADTNGDVITYRFSSATADDTFITITTQ